MPLKNRDIYGGNKPEKSIFCPLKVHPTPVSSCLSTARTFQGLFRLVSSPSPEARARVPESPSPRSSSPRVPGPRSEAGTRSTRCVKRARRARRRRFRASADGATDTGAGCGGRGVAAAPAPPLAPPSMTGRGVGPLVAASAGAGGDAGRRQGDRGEGAWSTGWASLGTAAGPLRRGIVCGSPKKVAVQAVAMDEAATGLQPVAVDEAAFRSKVMST